ncbi:MAG: hypothetical protein QXU97_01425 [Fervidicoccaceae archaeon]
MSGEKSKPSIIDYLKKTGGEEELSLVEERLIGSTKRFRFKHARSGIVIDVGAPNKELAEKKAREILSRLFGEEASSLE